MSVARSLVKKQPLHVIREFILERNPTDVMSVARSLGKRQPLCFVREIILMRNLINVMSVGSPSITAQNFVDIS